MIALKKKLLLKKILLVCLLLSISKFAGAQDICNPDFEEYCDEDIDVPLDSEIYLLIIAGIAIGVRKIRSTQSSNLSEQL